jgi:predicted O-linked N-acetylglucosamine transferase (SPINDLY family)
MMSNKGMMLNKGSKTRTDSELTRQLEVASDSEKPVEAVFMLHPDNPSQIVPSPERVEELTHKILERVQQRTGSHENKFNIFRNIGSFVVSAPAFVRELISQPEVATAMANQQPGQSSIKPVKQRPVRSGQNQKPGSSKKRAKVYARRTKVARAKSGK